jgi:hypothetical protein
VARVATWNTDARKVVTRLVQRSAAVVDWVDVVRVSDVLEINGVLPAKVLREIEAISSRAHCPGRRGDLTRTLRFERI